MRSRRLQRKHDAEMFGSDEVVVREEVPVGVDQNHVPYRLRQRKGDLDA